eukprot:TRINITY_DN5305_c0_g1_i1.p1 TRINITY_DN5305_c0_g1~~TRINITY_DN5305_c0_g1_i1.p1  ORF type:complete len:228 (+),score=22.97 TRINITY_DN5305_c0_g1_i1:216-899(+)
MHVVQNTLILFTLLKLLSVQARTVSQFTYVKTVAIFWTVMYVFCVKPFKTRMNLEMAVTDEMVEIALQTKPEFVCLVPEKREELTTEGGLDVVGQLEKIKAATKKLTDAGIKVSLFIDADRQQIEAAKKCGAPFIELHTGHYADATTEDEQQAELKKIAAGASYAHDLGIIVNAGHGLTYHNVAPIAALPEIYELNIGHSIIGRAVFDGLNKAVADMKALMIEARQS